MSEVPSLTRHDVDSGWIEGPRRVTVYRASGTSASAPVQALILHDGQNLFEPDRAHVPGHHWRVAETVAQLTVEGKLPPLVVVGLDHAGDGRIRELTPTGGGHEGAGQSWRYGRFIVHELLPMLVREYGVNTTGGQVAMGGSSLGGLATLAIAQQYPRLFGRLLVMSPSLWWDNRVIIRRLARHPLASATRIWLDGGGQEGRELPRHLRELRRVLRDQLDEGHLAGSDEPAGDHSEDSWARRLPSALTWLFQA